MGSKRAMLKNGLGDLLDREVPKARRFVDLFAGSAAVSTHVATRFKVTNLAFDLQAYSVILAEAVLCRCKPLKTELFARNWQKRASEFVREINAPELKRVSARTVLICRDWCDAQEDLPITKAYGGHYFSPSQAVWIDGLYRKLPKLEPARTVALAAIIHAASQCVAAPGHTAQPFQPTQGSMSHLTDAWNRNIWGKTSAALEQISGQFAQKTGSAKVADANEAAKRLRQGDLAFIDPPYSGVHYSRFYHVLETISQGSCGNVSGVGRYPAPEFRPRSKYSIGSESTKALHDLLRTVSLQGARAILTFPDHSCSNGLSGSTVREIAGRHFNVIETCVTSRFSTLGGTGRGRGKEAGRAARREANELILVLDPK